MIRLSTGFFMAICAAVGVALYEGGREPLYDCPIIRDVEPRPSSISLESEFHILEGRIGDAQL